MWSIRFVGYLIESVSFNVIHLFTQFLTDKNLRDERSRKTDLLRKRLKQRTENRQLQVSSRNSTGGFPRVKHSFGIRDTLEYPTVSQSCIPREPSLDGNTGDLVQQRIVNLGPRLIMSIYSDLFSEDSDKKERHVTVTTILERILQYFLI